MHSFSRIVFSGVRSAPLSFRGLYMSVFSFFSRARRVYISESSGVTFFLSSQPLGGGILCLTFSLFVHVVYLWRP